MTIEVRCAKCGKGYRVTDDKAGRSFRCKECQAKIVVPAGDAEDDLWGEDFGSFDEPEENPYSSPPKRKKKSKSKKRRRSRNVMPGTVKIAMGGLGLTILLAIVNVILNPNPRLGADMPYTAGFVGGMLVMVAIIGGMMAGLAQRSNVVRWITVVLYSLGLLCNGCGLAMLVSTAGIAASLEQQGLNFTAALVLMAIQVGINLTIIVCLMLEPSNEWFA